MGHVAGVWEGWRLIAVYSGNVPTHVVWMQVSQEDGVYVPSLHHRRLQLFQQNTINTTADVRDHVGVGIGAAKSRIYQ